MMTVVYQWNTNTFQTLVLTLLAEKCCRKWKTKELYISTYVRYLLKRLQISYIVGFTWK